MSFDLTPPKIKLNAWLIVSPFAVCAVIFALLSFCGCASVPRATSGGRLLEIWPQISDRSFIRVRGIGAVDQAAKGQTARRGASRDAALVAARYELLAVIKGVKLEGGVSVAQLIEKDSLIREIANEVVSGGDEIKTEWMSDDGCVVTLELRRSKVERLIHEKSQREKNLEERVDRDIAEIEKLNMALYVAIMNRSDRRDWADVRDRAVKAKKLADEVTRLGVMVDRMDADPNNGALEGAVLNQIIDTSSRLAEEEKAACWFPLSPCYWGHGKWSSK